MKRHLLTIICIVLLASCKSQYVNLEKDQAFDLSSDCPKEGKCSLQVKDDFTYNFEENEFKEKPKLKEKSTEKVLVFNYSKNENSKIADDFYKEEIWFILPKELEIKSYIDDELSEFKLIYGRFCFCSKESVGYFPITNGTMEITKNKIDLKFEVDSDPHKIHHLTMDILN